MSEGLQVNWVPLVIEHPDGVVVRFQVTADAVSLRGVRLMVSALEQQDIADAHSAGLLTPYLCDEIHAQALRVRPVIQVPPGSGRITATASHQEWNRYTNEAVARAVEVEDVRRAAEGLTVAPEHYLISGHVKDWVLCNQIHGGDHELRSVHGKPVAANYGWYDDHAPYKGEAPRHFKMWQTLGTRHNREHRDPSQCCRLVHQAVEFKRAGSEVFAWMRYDGMLTSPTHHRYVSPSGLLVRTRYAG